MKTQRAKRLQSEQTINLIIEAAARLFVTKGYHGTSIAAIAEATNLTKGALYSHFAGKADLLFALIKKFETEFLDGLIESVEGAPGDAIDKLHCFVSYSSDFAEKNPELCLLLTTISAEFSRAHSEFDSELRRIYAKYARFLRRLVELGKVQGVYDPELDTHSLAYTIMAIHDGTLMQWHRSREFLDGPEFVHTFRQVLIRGVAPHGSKRLRKPKPGSKEPQGKKINTTRRSKR